MTKTQVSLETQALNKVCLPVPEIGPAKLQELGLGGRDQQAEYDRDDVASH